MALATRGGMKSIAFAVLCATASFACAADFVVDAKNNSSSGGTAVSTIFLNAGDAFTVTVAADDLWSAGALPRWSNADGLVADTYATGSDESGEALGTHIGKNFGLWNQFSFSAPYGALVGEIGGDYYLLGTNFAGNALNSGTLKLMYWDSNNGDNTQFVTAHVNAVPEPGTMAAAAAGLLALVRRRKSA